MELVTGVKAGKTSSRWRFDRYCKNALAVYYPWVRRNTTTGHDNVRFIANLQLLCGNIGIGRWRYQLKVH
ncbi:hypothetical protein OK016_02575 [Vibrio chagasii]|nr:hypothetical protein [Vibrio chagasii]